MNNAIEIDNISKEFHFYNSPLTRLKSLLFKGNHAQKFHVLNNINLNIKTGETLGIIGENGAGKSTLLKLISGVLEPSSGKVSLKGKILSILELGVGLHPEFTGRENIFFYGDVLGFGRDFILSKIDEIIEFSELKEYIDQPVKTYSSGMVMRLAFSIVSSFDPDVIILDEVLAVGDMYFQKKSLNKILEFKSKGKTIIYCAHDLYQIRMIADRVIWIKNGRIEDIGDPEKVIFNYEMYQMKKEMPVTSDIQNAPVFITDVKLLNNSDIIRTFDDLLFQISTISVQNVPYHVMLSIKIEPTLGVCAAGTHFKKMEPLRGSRVIKFTFPEQNIIRGSFYAHARIFDQNGMLLYHEKTTPHFEVLKNCDEIGISYMPCEIKIEKPE